MIDNQQPGSYNPYWDAEKKNDLLIRLIGFDYGPEPAANEAAIIADKERLAARIGEDLRINANQIGAEIGSGCGYMTRYLGSRVKKLYALDISSSFLSYARSYCHDLPNVEFAKTPPGSLQNLSDGELDFIFASNVFVHLNLYELVTYFREINRVLRVGGRFWFDILELERVDFANDPDFRMSMDLRRCDPNHRGSFEFNSVPAVTRALASAGLQVSKYEPVQRCNTKICGIKTSPTAN